ncbi:MAG: translation initiation factor IF-6 [Candidatus Aenigmatarchaeota archaeon]
MPFHFLKADFAGDPNVGLYGFATDKYCLLGWEPSGKARKRMSEILKVPVHVLPLFSSALIGLFASGNGNGIVVTKLVEKRELEQLKCALPDINILVLKSVSTALGNLVLCNDSGCLIPEKFSKFKKEISDALGCEVATGTIAGLELVGSAAVASNKGCLCHHEATEDEAERLEGLLKVKVDVGTVGFGSPFIKSGLIVNSSGVIVSNRSTGPELGRMADVFGD